MRIVEVTDKHILFDNGNEITAGHRLSCCENNYADFESLEEMAMYHDFPIDLKFELSENSGFRFGDDRIKFFIPCYSEQNGWYSSNVEVYYNGVRVFIVEADII